MKVNSVIKSLSVTFCC